MRGVLLSLALSVAALAACTTSEPLPPSTPSPPDSTSPSPPSFETFTLEVGEQRVNLKPRVASPGNVVICGGRRVRVPDEGKHRGASGEVWVITATTGSVSMGCGTEVLWGHDDIDLQLY